MEINFDTSKLAAHLEEVQRRVVQGGKRKAVLAGARVIAKAMAERTPIQRHRTPGSDSLDVGELKANIVARTGIDDSDGEPTGLAGPKGEVAYVAHFVEYGHRIVSGGYSHVLPGGKVQGPGKVHDEEVPPHPFLRPAFEQSADAALAAVTEELTKQFEGL